jgi:short-subunit dehydrogenase
MSASAASKTAIIVGASRGIGASLARDLAQRGYRLGLLARNQEQLHNIATELRDTHQTHVEIGVLDVCDQASVAPALQHLFHTFGTVDLVIVNSGVVGVRKAGDGNIAEDRRIIETNLMGAIAVTDVAMAFFKQQGHGHLVGISSISASFAIPGSGAYSASKAALTNYLEALRVEVARYKINVSIVHPGFVNTDLAPGMEKYPFVATPEKVAHEIVEGIIKKKKNMIVPRLPWGVLMPVLRLMPERLKSKVF